MESSTNKDEDRGQPSQGTQPKKSFANSFAYLKNTDLYKLPEKPTQPVLPPPPRNTNAIIVNSCQRGNPILKFIRNIPYEYGEIVPDYQIGERHCALFLSLRYHNLNPNYIHDRLAALGSKYDLRIILVQVDVKNCRDNLKELSKMCMLANCTLILAWSAEEAGRYLETYKQYENKPPDILQERVETDYFAQLQDVLTTVKSVNKTDALTLLSSFGSLKCIINAKKDEILLCPGFGEQKAQRLYKVFNEPFKRTSVNEQVSVEQETSSVLTDGTLPSTSKLKRPHEINLATNCSDDGNSKKEKKSEKSEKSEKSCSSPAKVPKLIVDQCSAKTDKEDDKVTVSDSPQPSKFSIDMSPMKERGNTLSTKKSDAPVQKKPSGEPSPSKEVVAKSSYVSKTQAILNAGLSRYKKNTTNVSPCKVQASDDNSRVPMGKCTPVKKVNKQITTVSPSPDKRGALVQVTGKSKLDLDEKQISPQIVSEKSRPSLTATSPVHRNQTDAAIKSPIRTSRVLTLGDFGSVDEEGKKFRVGSRVNKVVNPSATTSSTTTRYSREITNEEYDDLLASDEEEDEDMLP